MVDAIVVGAGLCGAVTARFIAEELDKKVLVLERREHIAGNIYDYVDDSGILVQRYGPHIFHTRKKEVFDYLQRFAEWKPFHLRCMVQMDGRYTPSPFNFKTIDDFFPGEEGERIKQHLAMEYPGRDRATIVEMLESQDPVVKAYADFLFAKDYSLYTAKQWGIDPSQIDISVLKRVPVLFSYEDGYFSDPYQAMPEGGFTGVVARMLDHPNITVQLHTDATEKLTFTADGGELLYEGVAPGLVVYTGPLDELYGQRFGALPYRSLRFEWQTHAVDSYQAAPVVAYPQAPGYTRITEYKKLPEQDVQGVSTIAVEYPLTYTKDNGAEPYYPIPTEESAKSYAAYRAKADSVKNMVLCGRLAEYRYYNMDDALARALEVCKQIRAHFGA